MKRLARRGLTTWVAISSHHGGLPVSFGRPPFHFDFN
jgi:hypothetical protein